MSIVLSLVKQNVAYNRVFFIIIRFSTIYNFSTMSNVTFSVSHGPDFIFPSQFNFARSLIHWILIQPKNEESRSENILKSEKMTVPGTLFHHNQLASVLTMVFPKPWWEGQYLARFYLIVLIKNRLICFLGKENVFFLNR